MVKRRNSLAYRGQVQNGVSDDVTFNDPCSREGGGRYAVKTGGGEEHLNDEERKAPSARQIETGGRVRQLEGGRGCHKEVQLDKFDVYGRRTAGLQKDKGRRGR